MDTNKAVALTEWFNLFGDLVGLNHVKELGEFVSGRHLPTVLTFMKEKTLPIEPSEKIRNRREFFEDFLSHLTNLQKVSPNKYYTELRASTAGYGQSDEIAKFLAIILYEIRINAELQNAAFDVILPKLSEKSRCELEDMMDYLDDCSLWPTPNNWTEIIRKAPTENAVFSRSASLYVTPTTPKNTRHPLRELNKTVPGRPCAIYSSSNEVSILHDSPKLRENRQRRLLQERENDIKRLKSELSELRHDLDQACLSKQEFKKEFELVKTQNEKLLTSLREKESEKNLIQDKYDALEIRLSVVKERKDQNDDKVNECRQLKIKNDELRLALDGTEEANARLKAKVQNLEDELLKASCKNRQLERDLDDVKEEARASQDRTARFEQTLKEREDQISDIRKKLDKEAREHEHCRSELQNLLLDNAESNRLMEDGNLELALLKEENAKYLETIDELETKLGSYELDQQSTRRSTLCLENRNLKMDAEKKHLMREIEKMKTRLEDYSSRALESESTASNLMIEKSNMEMELSTARLQLIDYDHMVKRISILEAEKASSEKQLEGTRSQLAETIERLTQRESDISGLSEELRTTQKKVETLEEEHRECPELKAKLTVIEEKSAEESERIKQLEEMVQQLTNQNTQYKEELEAQRTKEEQFEKKADDFFLPPEDIFELRGARATDIFGRMSCHTLSEINSDLTSRYSTLPTWNPLEPEDEDTLMEQRTIKGGEILSLTVNDRPSDLMALTDSSLHENISKVSSTLGSNRQKSCTNSLASGTTATSDGVVEDLAVSSTSSKTFQKMRKAFGNMRASARTPKTKGA